MAWGPSSMIAQVREIALWLRVPVGHDNTRCCRLIEARDHREQLDYAADTILIGATDGVGTKLKIAQVRT